MPRKKRGAGIGRRPRRSQNVKKQFTVMEKLSVIDLISADNPRTKVAREVGLLDNTLRGWLRNEATLRSYAKKLATDEAKAHRQRMLKSEYVVLDTEDVGPSAAVIPSDCPGVEWDATMLENPNAGSPADVFTIPKSCSLETAQGRIEPFVHYESVVNLKNELEPEDMGAVESLLSLQAAGSRASMSLMTSMVVKREPGVDAEQGGPCPGVEGICPIASGSSPQDHLYYTSLQPYTSIWPPKRYIDPSSAPDSTGKGKTVQKNEGLKPKRSKKSQKTGKKSDKRSCKNCQRNECEGQNFSGESLKATKCPEKMVSILKKCSGQNESSKSLQGMEIAHATEVMHTESDNSEFDEKADCEKSPRITHIHHCTSETIQIESGGQSVSVPVDFVFESSGSPSTADGPGELSSGDEGEPMEEEEDATSMTSAPSGQDEQPMNNEETDKESAEDKVEEVAEVKNEELAGERACSQTGRKKTAAARQCERDSGSAAYRRNGYTILEKLKIISRVIMKGETQAQVSRDLKIPESTLRGWLREEEQLRNYVTSRAGDVVRKRKKVKSGRYPELDKAVLDWFVKNRTSGKAVTGPQLIQQAQQLYTTIYGKSGFLATSGWLARWKNRHGVNKNNMAGTFNPDSCMPLMRAELEQALALSDDTPLKAEKAVKWDVDLVLNDIVNTMSDAHGGLPNGNDQVSDEDPGDNRSGQCRPPADSSMDNGPPLTEEPEQKYRPPVDEPRADIPGDSDNDSETCLPDSSLCMAATSGIPDEMIPATDAIVWAENLISWAKQQCLAPIHINHLQGILARVREKALEEWTKEQGIAPAQVKQLQKVLGL